MFKISIITVVFNNLNGIKKTIESVINQTYQNKEYIIIDGGSTDGTVEFVIKFSKSINHFMSEKDNGIFDAMNKGLDFVSGDFVIFMNSSDTFYNEETLTKIFSLNYDSNTGIIFGDTIISKLNNEKSYIPAKPLNFIKKGRLPFLHQSAFVRTDLMKKNLFSDKYYVSADFYLFLKLYKERCNFQNINLPVSIYEIGGFSYSNLLIGDKQKKAILKEFGFSTFIPNFLFLINKLKFKFRKRYSVHPKD